MKIEIVKEYDGLKLKLTSCVNFEVKSIGIVTKDDELINFIKSMRTTVVEALEKFLEKEKSINDEDLLKQLKGE
jgi:hypothetical protein